jgi:1-acyl-sn-glycerol-3-phosphate acyltransferase
MGAPPARDPAADRRAWFFNGFRDHYLPRYLRKHFHAVRLAKGSAAIPAAGPLVVVMNHPGWWDPLVACELSRRFAPGTEHFGAIDADALRVYRFFKLMGFVGVDTKSVRGAAAFLRTGQALLSKSDRAFWLTAQGEFADVRRRPLDLRSGVGHLAARLEAGFVLPVAVEYAFWQERLPEALVRVGDPLPVGEPLGGKEWTRRIEAALTATMDALAADAVSRDPARFETLLGGTARAGGVYDLWRKAKAAVTGRRFAAGHMDAVREAAR